MKKKSKAVTTTISCLIGLGAFFVAFFWTVIICALIWSDSETLPAIATLIVFIVPTAACIVSVRCYIRHSNLVLNATDTITGTPNTEQAENLNATIDELRRSLAEQQEKYEKALENAQHNQGSSADIQSVPIQDSDRVVEAIKELKYSLREQKEISDNSLEKARIENEELKTKLAAMQIEKESLERAAKDAAQRDFQDKMTIVNAEMLTVDLMEGHDFENWCAEALRNSGFSNVKVTPGSGDQGVDVVAEKDGLKYAIQCKRYNSDLGNTPVQEVFTGARFYNCHVGVVITNRNFTSGAKDAAAATGVLLWGRSWILEYLYRKHGVMPEADPNA